MYPDEELLELSEAYSVDDMVSEYEKHYHSCPFCKRYGTICPNGAAIFCAKIIGDLTYLIDMFLVPDDYPPALVTGDKICRSIGILLLQDTAQVMVYQFTYLIMIKAVQDIG